MAACKNQGAFGFLKPGDPQPTRTNHKHGMTVVCSVDIVDDFYYIIVKVSELPYLVAVKKHTDEVIVIMRCFYS